jgi:predicted secreted protein
MPSTTTLTKSDAGRLIDLKPGDVLVIVLDETPGTGYRWAFAQDVPKNLRLKESRYVAPTTVERSGQPGTHHWTFEAQTAGEARLVLKRVRPWEPDALKPETFEIDVHVAL